MDNFQSARVFVCAIVWVDYHAQKRKKMDCTKIEREKEKECIEIRGNIGDSVKQNMSCNIIRSVINATEATRRHAFIFHCTTIVGIFSEKRLCNLILKPKP